MLLVVLAAAALLGGCSGGDDGSPSTLLDGTAAGELPVELEGVQSPTVLTSASVLAVDSIEPGSAADTCLQERFSDHEPAGSAVMRVGVSSESVTFREAPDVAVFGCSNSPGPREEDRRWCGGAYGQLTSGRLRDPRLSIICTSPDGVQVGFAWVQPGASTRYIAVEQPEYTEVYETAGDLPVRIFTTSGVDIERSGATFDASEHDAEGRLLREYELDAVVAG